MGLSTPTSAAINGDVDALRTFLEEDASLAVQTNAFGLSLLMLAAKYAQVDAVELLLPHSDVHQQDINGDNALLLACQVGESVCEGGTPLSSATKDRSERNVAACVRLLLASNSNPLQVNRQGCTPLMAAAFEGHFLALTALLPVSDVQALDQQQQDACANALRRRHGPCAALLLQHLPPQRTQDALRTPNLNPSFLLEGLAFVEHHLLTQQLKAPSTAVSHSSTPTMDSRLGPGSTASEPNPEHSRPMRGSSRVFRL